MVAVGHATRFQPSHRCSICGKAVPRFQPKVKWQGMELELCALCQGRYERERNFRAWADRLLQRRLRSTA